MVAAFGTGRPQKRQGKPLVDIWSLWHAGLLPAGNRTTVVTSDGTRHDVDLSSWIPRPDWRPGSSLPAFVCPACGRRTWRLWENDHALGCRACAGTSYARCIPVGEWSTWGNPDKMEARATVALGRRLRRTRLLVRAARRRKDIRDAGG